MLSNAAFLDYKADVLAPVHLTLFFYLMLSSEEKEQLIATLP